MKTIRLNNGIEMPALGYGVFQITDPDACKRCVMQAIETGYRLFDTASAYQNEQAVGDGCHAMIDQGKVKREDLFITTKVWLQDFGAGKTKESVEKSLAKMGLDYLDLVLLHQPFGNWQDAWKELEELYHSGVIRTIGVSNFNEKKMKQLLKIAYVLPAVNQIERHPFFAQNMYMNWMKKKGIQLESWGALNEGMREIFRNPVLMEIGGKYGKTAAQTAIAWNIQTGSSALIKTVRKEKMEEDFHVFDFTLSDEDIDRIAVMDEGYNEIIDLDSPVIERLLLKSEFHA